MNDRINALICFQLVVIIRSDLRNLMQTKSLSKSLSKYFHLKTQLIPVFYLAVICEETNLNFLYT